MKKYVYTFFLVVVVSVLFTGCANQSLNSMINSLNFPKSKSKTTGKKNDEIVLYHPKYLNIIVKGDNYKVGKGYLIVNGQKFFEENGDIEDAAKINGQLYYLLRTNQNWQLKRFSDKKIVKTFNSSLIFMFSDNKTILLAVRLKGNHSGDFDNLYKFDGKNISLIDKNIRLDGIYDKRGIYYFTKGAFKDSDIYSLFPSSVLHKGDIYLDSTYKDTFLGVDTTKRRVVGAIGDYLFYIYNYNSNNSILACYNLLTGKYYDLIGPDVKFQVFKSGHQVILKIFDNKNLHTESDLFSSIPKTKYANQPAKYFWLNKLVYVKGMDSSFKPVLLKSWFYNAAGSKTTETYITMDTDILQDNYTNRDYQLLF